MIPVNIRKQGASAIITIPGEVLQMLDAEVGDTLVIDVKKGQFTAKPKKAAERRHFSARELLKGVNPEKMKALLQSTETNSFALEAK